MMKTRLLRALGVCALLGGLPPAAGSQVSDGPAPARRFLRLLASSTDAGPAPTLVFADMPDMTSTFSLRAREEGCVVATFSGAFQQGVSNEPAGSLTLRVLLDGELMEGHNPFGRLAEPILPGANIFRSYTFWKCGLATGTHTIAVQWYTHAGAPPLYTRGRTLVVQGG